MARSRFARDLARLAAAYDDAATFEEQCEAVGALLEAVLDRTHADGWDWILAGEVSTRQFRIDGDETEWEDNQTHFARRCTPIKALGLQVALADWVDELKPAKPVFVTNNSE